MDTQETKPKILRPVIKAEHTGQLGLFGGPKPSTGRHRKSDAVRSLMFNDPDPETLAFGDGSLRNYLESVDLGFAFVIRDLFDELDWSVFEGRYKAGGRYPYAPRRMISLIVYGISQGVTSLRALEQLARRDLVALWLMAGVCPDHSKIGRFIRLHHEELSTELFESLTRAILSKLTMVDREIAGDGTVIEACASRYTQIKKEALEKLAAETREASKADPEDVKKQRKAEQMQESLDACQKRIDVREAGRSQTAQDVRINPSDPHATIHKLKRGIFAFGYIISILANRQRIILSCDVHTASEIAMIPKQLDQVERVLEGSFERLTLDSNYFCKPILDLMCERVIDVLCPAPETTRSAKGKKKKNEKKPLFAKYEFRYNSDEDCYTCPANQTLTPTSKGFDKQSSQHYKNYSTKACKDCPLRDQCTKSTRNRRIKRFEGDDVCDAMRLVMKNPKAQEAYSHRQGSVEPIFGELKCIQGLERFRRTRIEFVRVECALHAMAHNLRRLKIAVRNTKRRNRGESTPFRPLSRPSTGRRHAFWAHTQATWTRQPKPSQWLTFRPKKSASRRPGFFGPI